MEFQRPTYQNVNDTRRLRSFELKNFLRTVQEHTSMLGRDERKKNLGKTSLNKEPAEVC